MKRKLTIMEKKLCKSVGQYLIRKKWFRIFRNGSYAKLEIDVGIVGHSHISFFIFSKDGLFKHKFYRN